MRKPSIPRSHWTNSGNSFHTTNVDGNFQRTDCDWVSTVHIIPSLSLLYYFIILQCYSLGKELGSGEFGRVVKAEAVGLLVKTESSTNDGVGIIRRAEEVAAMTTTTVAVKMVRPQLLLEDQIVALKALVSELKVMIALESHLNVVNLMGACTRNISRGKYFNYSVKVSLLL